MIQMPCLILGQHIKAELVDHQLRPRVLVASTHVCSGGQEKFGSALLFGVWMRWDWDTLPNVDGDVARIYAALELAHLRVLPSSSEQPRRFHTEVAHWLLVTIH